MTGSTKPLRGVFKAWSGEAKDLMLPGTSKHGGPCAKQEVRADIFDERGAHIATGSNDVRNPQGACPREAQGFRTGEGYGLCKSVCDQQGHAEAQAIDHAAYVDGDYPGHLIGCYMTVRGHTYACEPCREACRRAGVREIRFLDGAGAVVCIDLLQPVATRGPAMTEPEHEALLRHRRGIAIGYKEGKPR